MSYLLQLFTGASDLPSQDEPLYDLQVASETISKSPSTTQHVSPAEERVPHHPDQVSTLLLPTSALTRIFRETHTLEETLTLICIIVRLQCPGLTIGCLL